MADLRDLYQDIILEHSKNPRNYRAIEAANRTAEGFNPALRRPLYGLPARLATAKSATSPSRAPAAPSPKPRHR